MKSLSCWIGLSVLSAIVLTGCGREETSKVEAKPAAPATQKVQAPLIQPTQMVDWCKEHTVPESVCTRCNSALIAEFQKKGDWCKTHELPESQCTTCHPELKAKFEAMAPKI